MICPEYMDGGRFLRGEIHVLRVLTATINSGLESENQQRGRCEMGSCSKGSLASLTIAEECDVIIRRLIM